MIMYSVFCKEFLHPGTGFSEKKSCVVGEQGVGTKRSETQKSFPKQIFPLMLGIENWDKLTWSQGSTYVWLFSHLSLVKEALLQPGSGSQVNQDTCFINKLSSCSL